MTLRDEIILAIDTANPHGVVTAFDAHQIYAEECMLEKMAHGRLICQSIERVESKLLEQGKSISAVLVGVGPGSFVGLRIAMATALGFSFGRQLPIMGFCSHRALACTYKPEASLAIVMKASGDWCYLTPYERSSHELIELEPPREILKNEVLASLPPHSILLSDLSFAPQDLAQKSLGLVATLGANASGIKQALQPLFKSGHIRDESMFLKPNYVRAPSVTPPTRRTHTESFTRLSSFSTSSESF